LVSISKIDRNSQVEYADHNISFTLPAGWNSWDTTTTVNERGGLGVYPGPSETMTKVTMHSFSEPEIKTWSGFTLAEFLPGEDRHLNLSKAAEEQIEISRIQQGDYRERPGSMEEVTVSGVSGIRYIVDRKSKEVNEDFVVYVFIVAAENKSLRLFFRTTKEDFDKYQPVFDSIVNSIKMNW